MFNELELKIIRIVIKLIGSIIAIYLIHSQFSNEVAKLCYKGGGCIIEAHRNNNPGIYWFLINMYVFITIALIISSINDIRGLVNSEKQKMPNK